MYTHVLYILNRDKDAQFYHLNDDDWTGNSFKTYQLTLYNMYLLAADGDFQPELYSSSETNRIIIMAFIFWVVVVMMNVL